MADGLDRATGIGGSDMAAVLGLSPFRSPFDVWMEKTNDAGHAAQADTPQMRLGRLLEPALAVAYEEDHPGARIIRHGGFDTPPLWHPNKIVYAHIDGEIVEPGESGVTGIWEGKSARDDRGWLAGVPDYYEAQVRLYLAVTGAPWCDVTVLYRTSGEIAHFRVDADRVIDASLIRLAERFWAEHVVPRIPPPIDGSDAAGRFLASRFPKEEGAEVMVADGRVNELGLALAALRVEISEAEAEKSTAENLIKEAMGEYGVIEGVGWRATWKRSKGRTEVAWHDVAGAYRGLLHQVGAALTVGRNDEALRILTDNQPDDIVVTYTRTSGGARPFVFRSAGKGEAK